MERLSVVLCVVLACVAPTMAADFWVVGGSGTVNPDHANVGTWYSYDYATPPVDDSTFLSQYQAPYIINPAVPYYTATNEAPDGTGQYASINYGPGGILDTPDEDFRQLNITATLRLGSAAVGPTVMNSLQVGEQYWGTYDAGVGAGVMPTWSAGIDQGWWPGAGSVHIKTVKVGHDQSEFAAPDLWHNTRWAIQAARNDEVFTVDDWHVVGTTTNTYVQTSTGNDKGVDHCMLWGREVNGMKLTVNIGNIYLNKKMMGFDMHAGVWNITGDIGLEPGCNPGEENAVFLLGGDILNYSATPQADKVLLNIQETVLDQLIADGMFYVTGANNGDDKYAMEGLRDRNTEINLLDPTSVANGYVPTAFDTITQVTAANKNYWLKVIDTDGGAGDMVSVHVIPEPATMALLGLGALVLRRKR